MRSGRLALRSSAGSSPTCSSPPAESRSGRTIAFAVRGRTLVFGLPGNPVSSLVSFELFVRPALLALQGARDPGPAYLPGRLGAAVERNEHRDELLRARTRIA